MKRVRASSIARALVSCGCGSVSACSRCHGLGVASEEIAVPQTTRQPKQTAPSPVDNPPAPQPEVPQPAFTPTPFPPGSEGKIQVLTERARLRLPLFHPSDGMGDRRPRPRRKPRQYLAGDPQVQLVLSAGLALGHSQRRMARTLGCSQAAVSRWLKAPHQEAGASTRDVPAATEAIAR